ncbi:MAG: hypothetical protein ACREUU_19080 [Gammaproteobacteria bacterium]
MMHIRPSTLPLAGSLGKFEIAFWKLRHTRVSAASLFIVLPPGEPAGMSDEPLSGKHIGLQDTMAFDMPGKTSRTMTRLIQATAAGLCVLIP